MIGNEPESVSLAIRMTGAMRDRIDALVGSMATTGTGTATTAGRLTRASVIRQALAIGVETLEKTAHSAMMNMAAESAVMSGIEQDESRREVRQGKLEVRKQDDPPRQVKLTIVSLQNDPPKR
ncbi:MAG: hypothetical protein H7838_07975 [Magnetococcus sp. DMHC-8]